VTEITNVPFCSFVHVEPESIDDWEILVSIVMCNSNSYLGTSCVHLYHISCLYSVCDKC